MLYVGSARVDTHKLTWRQIDSKISDSMTISYKRNKTDVSVTLRVHEDLQKALVASPRNHVVIITTEYGKPFSVEGFSVFMRRAITQAGLPHSCRPHGLRKTLGRKLADAGCSAHEIQAALGHQTLAMAEKYCRDADRRRGGAAAIAKLEAPQGRSENVFSQTPDSSLGVPRKT
jgi:enterobacteria phage integrase